MAIAHRMGGAIRIGGIRGEGTWMELRLPRPAPADAAGPSGDRQPAQDLDFLP
jgi:hypothetical protein